LYIRNIDFPAGQTTAAPLFSSGGEAAVPAPIEQHHSRIRESDGYMKVPIGAVIRVLARLRPHEHRQSASGKGVGKGRSFNRGSV
jgi:hypothetical protein